MNKHNNGNKLAYSSIANIYAGNEPGEDDPIMRKQTRDAFTSKLTGKKILEIGCGPGIDSKFFHDEGFEVTATDFCEEFIEIVKKRYPQINSLVMDMTDITLPDNSYNGIYGFASFIHLPRKEALPVLKKFRSLLEINGVLYLTLIKSEIHDEYYIENWGGKEGNRVLFTCYSEDEFKDLLNQAGFSSIEFSIIKSELYEKLPRLVERKVKTYHITAIKD